MAIAAVVDDHAVLSLLAYDGSLGRFATTCSWWWRLTSAINASRGGQLSRRIDSIESSGVPVRAMIETLDEFVEIVDLKLLIPTMGSLVADAPHAINQLAAEAVAAALVLDTRVQVEQHTPPLAELCAHAGIAYARSGPGRP